MVLQGPMRHLDSRFLCSGGSPPACGGTTGESVRRDRSGLPDPPRIEGALLVLGYDEDLCRILESVLGAIAVGGP
jgi:hypothetical protein